MASTLLNEQGYNGDWIERLLARAERDNVGAPQDDAGMGQLSRRLENSV
jgi:hypothetical protein